MSHWFYAFCLACCARVIVSKETIGSAGEVRKGQGAAIACLFIMGEYPSNCKPLRSSQSSLPYWPGHVAGSSSKFDCPSINDTIILGASMSAGAVIVLY